ncbi:MAG: SEC-C metal-binding domain-containing protein, partial [Gemmatimonadaceae bacterium]
GGGGGGVGSGLGGGGTAGSPALRDGRAGGTGDRTRQPARRYNALGVLETEPAAQPAGTPAGTPAGAPAGAAAGAVDIGPDQPPAQQQVARRDPVVVGAGRTRSLSSAAEPVAGGADWSSVGRNDPCPCGSGKKFKKCHGAVS